MNQSDIIARLVQQQKERPPETCTGCDIKFEPAGSWGICQKKRCRFAGLAFCHADCLSPLSFTCPMHYKKDRDEFFLKHAKAVTATDGNGGKVSDFYVETLASCMATDVRRNLCDRRGLGWNNLEDEIQKDIDESIQTGIAERLRGMVEAIERDGGGERGEKRVKLSRRDI